MISTDIVAYNNSQDDEYRVICERLCNEIERNVATAENKLWHGHPVWFLADNPIVGYSKLKGGVRLLFWSGQSFQEPGLSNTGTFKAAEARYSNASEIHIDDLARWLAKSQTIQWDYKNIVKRKGKLERL